MSWAGTLGDGLTPLLCNARDLRLGLHHFILADIFQQLSLLAYKRQKSTPNFKLVAAPNASPVSFMEFLVL